jgi:hypothetical protein
MVEAMLPFCNVDAMLPEALPYMKFCDGTADATTTTLPTGTQISDEPVKHTNR